MKMHREDASEGKKEKESAGGERKRLLCIEKQFASNCVVDEVELFTNA